jgi:large subunit ribosomal protein L17
MRHGMINRKLGRKSGHRAAMFRNQITSMIENERIITTLPKAKELRPLVEKMVTLGRDDSVHARRLAARTISDETALQKLFGTIGPRFASTPGGYTRIVKLGSRRGDGAEMAIIEFTDFKFESEKGAAPAQKKGRAAKKAEPAAEEQEAAPATEEAPPKKTPPKKAAPKRTASKKAAPSGQKARPKKTTREKKGEK